MQGVSESRGDIVQPGVGGILVGAIAPCLSTVIYCSLQFSVECKEEKVVTTVRFLVLWRAKRTGDLFTLTGWL